MSLSLKTRISADRDLMYLLLLLFIAGCLRFWSISYGLPAAYNSTEYFIAKQALSLGARRTLQPLFFIYPTFYSYFIAIIYGFYYALGYLAGWFSSSSDFAVQFMLNPTAFYLMGRISNALVIIISAVFIYKTSRLFISAAWSFLIALLFLNSINVFEFTFWMVPDAFLLLGTSLVCYFILKGFRKGIAKWEIILASLICGLTISSKYNAGFLALGWLVYLFFFADTDFNKRLKSAAMALFTLLLGFLIGSPYWILSFPKFWAGFKMIVSQAQYAYNFETGIPYWWEAKNLVGSDWLLGIIIILFMLMLLIKMNRVTIPLAAIVWPTFLYVGSWEKKGLDYLLIIFPVIILYLAVWLPQITANKSWKRWVAFGLWLAVLLNFPRLVYKNYLYRQPDTRQLTSNWIVQNYPPGSKICYDHYHYDINLIDMERFLEYGEGSKYLNPAIRNKLLQESGHLKSYQFISAQKKLKKLIPTDSLYVLAANDSFLLQAYQHPHRSMEEIKAAGAELLILNSDSYLKFIMNPPPLPWNRLRMDFIDRQKFYQQVLDSLPAVKVFEPSRVTPGPTMRIYDLRRI
jgi:hypothetical protein